jgi:hypothetical protein
MAELMLGQPLFPGESGIDQLVEIIKVLGTPTREQIRTMNPNYMEHRFPQIKPHPFNKVSSSLSSIEVEAYSLLGVPQGFSRCYRSNCGVAGVHPHTASLRDRGNVSAVLRRVT